MKKFRKYLIIFASVILLAQVFIIVYRDLGKSGIIGSSLSIFAMLLLIISMLLQNRYDEKNKST